MSGAEKKIKKLKLYVEIDDLIKKNFAFKIVEEDDISDVEKIEEDNVITDDEKMKEDFTKGKKS